MSIAVILSPSQIATWRGEGDGRRAWAHRYIAKRKGPDKASAALGTAVHAQCERYLRGEGFDYSTVFTKKAAEIAQRGTHLLPAPCTPGMRVENRPIGASPVDDKNFRFTDVHGVTWQGRMDVTVEDSIVVPGLWGGAPAVLDHKTSSNVEKYALIAEDLHTDPAAVIYAYYLMGMYQSSMVDLQWIYYQTKGKQLTLPVRQRVYSPRVVDEFGKLSDVGLAVRHVLQMVRDPLEIPPCEGTQPRGSGEYGDPCNAYGGCPYKEFCPDVFDRFGLPITAGVSMNGTAAGQALMQQIAQDASIAAPPPDPYLAYAAWRTGVPASAVPPGYEALEARYLASLPPPVVALKELAPFALPLGITNAPPGYVPAPFLWEGKPVEPGAITEGGKLSAFGEKIMASLPPTINPPGEFQAAPTVEERSAVLVPAEKAPGKRTRRTKAEMAAARAESGAPTDTHAAIYEELSDLFARLAVIS